MRKKFKYVDPPPFLIVLRLAKYELENIDRFVDLTDRTKGSELRSLERIASEASANVPDDWLTDDFAQIDDFATLSSEFAIVGLWRCVELYRKRAVSIDNSTRKLSNLQITEENIRCARSVNELRCLNNALKHEQRIGGDLVKLKFQRWRGKDGENLGNLKPHYGRLRPLVERYLEDLTDRLNRWWKSNRL